MAFDARSRRSVTRHRTEFAFETHRMEEVSVEELRASSLRAAARRPPPPAPLPPGAAAAEWMAAAARAKKREAGKAAALAAAQWIFVAGAAADRRRLRRAFAQIRRVAKTRPTPAARAEAHDLLGRLYLRRATQCEKVDSTAGRLTSWC